MRLVQIAVQQRFFYPVLMNVEQQIYKKEKYKKEEEIKCIDRSFLKQ